MPPHKKWKDNAERQRAFQLKKIHPDYDDNQIRALLGKPELKQPNTDLGSRHNPTIPPGNDGSSLPEPMEITESYAEQFLIRCAQRNPGDPKVAALLIQWLDKKKALEPKVNLDEQSSSITEYKEIREQFYGRTTACRDAATD
jgi:hypothetical protein